LLIIVPLFVNKYVYDFRVNQETGLKLFTLIVIFVWLIKIINTGKYSLKKTKFDLPLILFTLEDKGSKFSGIYNIFILYLNIFFNN